MKRYFCDVCGKPFKPQETSISSSEVFLNATRFLRVEDVCKTCQSAFPALMRQSHLIESFIREWKDAARDDAEDIQTATEDLLVDDAADDAADDSNSVDNSAIAPVVNSSEGTKKRRNRQYTSKLDDDTVRKYADKVYSHQLTGKAAAAELGVNYATLVRSISRLGLPPIGRKMQPVSDTAITHSEETSKPEEVQKPAEVETESSDNFRSHSFKMQQTFVPLKKNL